MSARRERRACQASTRRPASTPLRPPCLQRDRHDLAAPAPQLVRDAVRLQGSSAHSAGRGGG